MFPMRVDHAGSIAMSSGVEELDSAIRMVLITAPGERLMRPNFGCRIWELLFEPINANTIGLMAVAVREALGQWEPRVDVESVTIEPLAGADGKVLIHIGYVVKATNDLRNLVFPFYVIPQEDEA
jgi:hypothetical protein